MLPSVSFLSHSSARLRWIQASASVSHIHPDACHFILTRMLWFTPVVEGWTRKTRPTDTLSRGPEQLRGGLNGLSLQSGTGNAALWKVQSTGLALKLKFLKMSCLQ